MSGDGLGRVYGDQAIVVRQGDQGDCMYAIQSGEVEVLRQAADAEVRLGVLRTGDIFGEMALFENAERSATVRAIGEVRVVSIDRKTFLRRIQEDPSLAFNLVRLLCGRVRSLNRALEKLSRAAQPAPALAELASASTNAGPWSPVG